MALTVGIIKSSGVLFVAFQDRFHSDSATTSLLSTVHNAVYSICGKCPVVSPLGYINAVISSELSMIKCTFWLQRNV